jgi:hypothetical protein
VRSTDRERDAGVEVHAVDALQFEDDVMALEIGNGGWRFHGGSGWALVSPKMEAPPHDHKKTERPAAHADARFISRLRSAG